MKKRLIVSAVILIAIAILGVSTVFATDMQPLTMDYTPIIDGDIATHAMEISNNVKEDSIYKAGEKVELNGEYVDGNVYLAGNDVKIENETINGDVFIFANNVEIAPNTIIDGNLFICASNVKLDASISRELFCVAKDVVFEKTAIIEYSANIAAEHIYVNGTFRRDVNCTVSNIEVDNATAIRGTLNYSSEQEAKMGEDASIGNINFSKQVEEKETALDVITEYFVLTMVLLIVFIKLLPKFINNLKDQFRVSSFGIGILSLIIVPILLVLMLVLRVTSTLAFAVLALFILVLILSMAITNISLAKKFEEKKPNIKLPIWTAIVTAVTWVVYQIPVLGGIVAFIWVATGLGMSIRYCFSKNK